MLSAGPPMYSGLSGEVGVGPFARTAVAALPEDFGARDCRCVVATPAWAYEGGRAALSGHVAHTYLLGSGRCRPLIDQLGEANPVPAGRRRHHIGGAFRRQPQRAMISSISLRMSGSVVGGRASWLHDGGNTPPC